MQPSVALCTALLSTDGVANQTIIIVAIRRNYPSINIVSLAKLNPKPRSMLLNSFAVKVVLLAPVTSLDTALEKLRPAESICTINFILDESVAYLGSVQEKVTTGFSESAGAGLSWPLCL
jgi:hypothetical protein